ncbi:MAG: twin-arginine translocase TatA/TatE family subunit [Legionella sp.]
MGLSGISPLSLVLILAIIIALFGTSKLKTLGTDLGEAIKNFRRALNDETNESDPTRDENKP